uniref:Uncharacterized protein n=1 Tax=Arundo donax TaxID=35708 RepID=A0A0A8YBA9_ARUDO
MILYSSHVKLKKMSPLLQKHSVFAMLRSSAHLQ